MAVVFESVVNSLTIPIFIAVSLLFFIPYNQAKEMNEIKACYYEIDKVYRCAKRSIIEDCKERVENIIKIRRNFIYCKSYFLKVKDFELENSTLIGDFKCTFKEKIECEVI